MNTVTVNEAGVALQNIDAELSALREQMADLNKARVTWLPKLSTTEREFLCDVEKRVERSEETVKKASMLRKSRQMTEEDKDQLAGARMAHRKEVNTVEVKERVAEQVRTAYLQSYKLTHRKDGRLGLTIKGLI